MSMQKPGDHPSMSKKVWGRAGWMYLHAVAWNFPLHPTRADRANALGYVRALMRTVPCPECARDFRALVLPDLQGNVDSPVFASRATFARATHKWHNAVNAKLGKPQVPFDRVRAWFGEVALDDDDEAVGAIDDAQYDARAVRNAQKRACVVGALLVSLIAVALGRQILYPHPSIRTHRPRTRQRTCQLQPPRPFR